MFHEIKTPIKVIRTQILAKLNVFSSLQNLSSDLKGADTPSPVNSDVSISEYKKRYRGLYIHKCIVLFFLLYSTLFVAFSMSISALIVSLAVFIFLLISYFNCVHRAWLARYYYRNWDKRDVNANLSFKDFLDAISVKKRILLPVFDITFKG